MRKIKFRVWDKTQEKYLNKFYLDYVSDGGFWQAIREDGVCLDIPENAQVEEYTGLNEKNGKEIYEGDVVCVPYIDCIFGDTVNDEICHDFKFIIQLHDESFVIYNKNRGYYYIHDFINRIEVIGNINENHELLEEKS
jgi:uncharacterized phage protein (TIGR01671 family)